MDEPRKYAILFAATILAARKLTKLGDKPSPAREVFIANAISNDKMFLRKIDQQLADCQCEPENLNL